MNRNSCLRIKWLFPAIMGVLLGGAAALFIVVLLLIGRSSVKLSTIYDITSTHLAHTTTLPSIPTNTNLPPAPADIEILHQARELARVDHRKAIYLILPLLGKYSNPVDQAEVVHILAIANFYLGNEDQAFLYYNDIILILVSELDQIDSVLDLTRAYHYLNNAAYFKYYFEYNIDSIDAERKELEDRIELMLENSVDVEEIGESMLTYLIPSNTTKGSDYYRQLLINSLTEILPTLTNKIDLAKAYDYLGEAEIGAGRYQISAAYFRQSYHLIPRVETALTTAYNYSIGGDRICAYYWFLEILTYDDFGELDATVPPGDVESNIAQIEELYHDDVPGCASMP